MIRGSAIGAEYADATPDNLVVHSGNREAWGHLSGMLEGHGYSVLLVGPPGTGKTRMLATVLNTIERKWPFGRYVYWTMPAFVDKRRDAVGGDTLDPVEMCIEAHVVVLDDLGAEKVTDYGREGLYMVLDERRKRKLITLAATNLSLRELPQIYGDRIMSRFMGEHGTIAAVTGYDWRVRQAANPKPVAWAEQIGQPRGILAEVMRQREDCVQMPDEVRRKIEELRGA